MQTFEKTLDELLSYDFSTRELIIDILQKRQIEERRNEIAKNIKVSSSDYNKGKLKSQSAKDAIYI